MDFNKKVKIAFKKCSKKYGVNFTVKQYKIYRKKHPKKSPSINKIFSKTTFNSVKMKVFGEDSLNRKKHSLKEIKKDYKEMCDRLNKTLNISEYGRNKDDNMVSARVMMERTTSDKLKQWYLQKKRDKELGTNLADKINLSKKNEFEKFCEVCALKNECDYNENNCPYWLEWKKIHKE